MMSNIVDGLTCHLYIVFVQCFFMSSCLFSFWLSEFGKLFIDSDTSPLSDLRFAKRYEGACLFIFLTGSFIEEETVIISMKPNWINFSFMDHAYGQIYKWSSSRSWRFSFHFFHKSFMILYFTFKARSHFELLFSKRHETHYS